jgi:hypothetical protein
MRKRFTFAVGIPALGGLVATALTVVPALATPPSGATSSGRSGPAGLFCGGHTPKRRTRFAPLHEVLRPCTRRRLRDLDSAAQRCNYQDLPDPGRLVLSEASHAPEDASEAVGRRCRRSVRQVASATWARSHRRYVARGAAGFQPTGGQAITVDDSAIEVPGTRLCASGIVVIGKRLNGGWFSLYGRLDTGPTGPLVSGTWSCS